MAWSIVGSALVYRMDITLYRPAQLCQILNHQTQFVPQGEAGLEFGPMQVQSKDIVANGVYKAGSQRSQEGGSVELTMTST